jgi:hypothetical protein
MIKAENRAAAKAWHAEREAQRREIARAEAANADLVEFRPPPPLPDFVSGRLPALNPRFMPRPDRGIVTAAGLKRFDAGRSPMTSGRDFRCRASRVRITKADRDPAACTAFQDQSLHVDGLLRLRRKVASSLFEPSGKPAFVQFERLEIVQNIVCKGKLGSAPSIDLARFTLAMSFRGAKKPTH